MKNIFICIAVIFISLTSQAQQKKHLAKATCVFTRTDLSLEKVFAESKPIVNYIDSLDSFYIEDRADFYLKSGQTATNQFVFTLYGNLNFNLQQYSLNLDIEDKFLHQVRASAESSGLTIGSSITYLGSKTEGEEIGPAKISCKIEKIINP